MIEKTKIDMTKVKVPKYDGSKAPRWKKKPVDEEDLEEKSGMEKIEEMTKRAKKIGGDIIFKF
jgi:hypothetical protein